jgi:hypothetical protein
MNQFHPIDRLAHARLCPHDSPHRHARESKIQAFSSPSK